MPGFPAGSQDLLGLWGTGTGCWDGWGLPRPGALYLRLGVGGDGTGQPGNLRHGPLLHCHWLGLGEGQQELGGEKLLVCPMPNSSSQGGSSARLVLGQCLG